LRLQVRIVRERGTGKVLAMKKLRKAEMLRRGQVEHVKAERNVLAEVHSPYIVKLYYSFQVRLYICVCVTNVMAAVHLPHFYRSRVPAPCHDVLATSLCLPLR
jgi:serine/threonine protein kinase